MFSLRKQMEQINEEFQQENKRLVEILGTLKKRQKGENWANQSKKLSSSLSKNSHVSTPSKKMNKSKNDVRLNSSIRTIKKWHKAEGSDCMERCSSCKQLKEKKFKQKDLMKKTKIFEQFNKRETKMYKLKKLSEKLIPRISSKILFSKKCSINRIQSSKRSSELIF